MSRIEIPLANRFMEKGDGILDPKSEATRAEVAAMLMSYCKTIE